MQEAGEGREGRRHLKQEAPERMPERKASQLSSSDESISEASLDPYTSCQKPTLQPGTKICKQNTTQMRTTHLQNFLASIDQSNESSATSQARKSPSTNPSLAQFISEYEAKQKCSELATLKKSPVRPMNKSRRPAANELSP